MPRDVFKNFVVVLFITSSDWKQPKSSQTVEWVNTQWNTV